ncbi:hypothetical protein B0H13DRAFT_1851112 [Mycena leptocephala]|nr:hypothetical protein B0H13DRAFT_1851112 [Mycena leptocephala]
MAREIRRVSGFSDPQKVLSVWVEIRRQGRRWAPNGWVGWRIGHPDWRPQYLDIQELARANFSHIQNSGMYQVLGLSFELSSRRADFLMKRPQFMRYVSKVLENVLSFLQSLTGYSAPRYLTPPVRGLK